MGRLFVFTLGYHENFAIRRLMEHHASRGDSVLGFTLMPAAGAAERAWESLKAFASRLGLEPHGLVELDCSNLAEASLIVAARVKGLGGYVVADLTGGPRCVVIAVFIGLIASGAKGEAWIQVEGGGGGEDRIPLTILRVLREGVSEARRRMLCAVARDPGIRPAELAEELDVSLKTVQNSLSELKRLGLVYQRGRGGGIYLTSWGRLFACHEHQASATPIRA